MVLREHAARLPGAGCSASFMRRKEILAHTANCQRGAYTSAPTHYHYGIPTYPYLDPLPDPDPDSDPDFYPSADVAVLRQEWATNRYRAAQLDLTYKASRKAVWVCSPAPPTKETIVVQRRRPGP